MYQQLHKIYKNNPFEEAGIKDYQIKHITPSTAITSLIMENKDKYIIFASVEELNKELNYHKQWHSITLEL